MFACLCKAAFVCSKFLYPLKYLFFNNLRLCIGKDMVIFRCILQTLFQLAGFGIGLAVDRAAHIFWMFQNPRYGFVIPPIQVILCGLSIAFCIAPFPAIHNAKILFTTSAASSSTIHFLLSSCVDFPYNERPTNKFLSSL